MTFDQIESAAKVAIAMPLGRLSQWFDEALHSALGQTLKTKVYLIANGLSEEENVTLKSLANRHSRIVLHSFPERVEMIANWNRALEIVREPYLIMLHDDDFLESWLVRSLIEAESENPGQGIYLTQERLIDAEGKFYNHDNLKRDGSSVALDRRGLEAWAVSNKICATGFMMDRSRAISLGGYKNEFTYTADWDLYFSMAHAFSAIVVDVHGARYRFGGGTGQASSSFLRSGSFIAEYRRQQLTNLVKIGADPVDFEKSSIVALESFCRVIDRQFGGGLDEKGVEALKEVRIKALIVRICSRVKALLTHPVSVSLLKRWFLRASDSRDYDNR